MNVVLVSINSKFIHSSLGVWYLYSASKTAKSQHNVSVYESTINNRIEDITEDIFRLNADVVGFSCYIWNIEYVKRISEFLKQINPQIKIFYGGPEASFDAENLIEKPYVDLIIKGEGEKSFINLLESNFDTEEKIVSNPCDIYCNPYTEEYFEKLNGRIVYLETSRGCPFCCAFCLSGRDETVRFFDMAVSKDNILRLANSGTQTVKFVDRTFNCNDKRALEIFKFIKNSRDEGKIPLNVVFHFEVEADLFSRETLDYLKTVPQGLFQFEAGLQSFNRETLKAVTRRHDTEKLISNLKEIASMGNIHLHIDLIAGLPYEDYQSFAKGFDLAYEISAEVIQLGFLKILKGSPLSKQIKEHGYVYSGYAPYQIIKNNYISYEDLLKLKTAEDAVERIYNSGRFPNTVKYLTAVSGLTPYQLFYSMGEYCRTRKIASPSLDKYTEMMFEHFSSLENTDKKILRDMMAKDKIITDKSGKIYPCLHISDSRLKHINIALKNIDMGIFENQREKAKQALIGFCIVYSEDKEQVVLADYTNVNKATGIYDNTVIPLEEFFKEEQ